MEIIGNGVDIVENKRIKNSLKIKGFINRVFTQNEINKSKESGDIEKARVLTTELINLSNSLGLLEQDPEIFLKSGVTMNESEVQVLIDEREKVRDAGNYSKADEIRDQLLQKNIIVEDSKEGTFWRRR